MNLNRDLPATVEVSNLPPIKVTNESFLIICLVPQSKGGYAPEIFDSRPDYESAKKYALHCAEVCKKKGWHFAVADFLGDTNRGKWKEK